MKRRHFMATGASTLLSACDWKALSREKNIAGGYVGVNAQLGHTLRDGGFPTNIEEESRTTVAIVGGGIAGLAVARQLRKAGITDYRIFDLESTLGGNSRSMMLEGIACPMGAHYLPVPDERNQALNEFLQEIKLLRVDEAQHNIPEERYLCHSPQERLLTVKNDRLHWQDGLLPIDPSEIEHILLANYAKEVGVLIKSSAFAIPTLSATWSKTSHELDQLSFSQWLTSKGLLNSSALRWYLDYCCRDDYGAGIDEVSAWAGLHYFASRHGFNAPGEKDHSNNESVFTWSEGNGYLAARLSAPHAKQTQTGNLVTQVIPETNRVKLRVWDTSDQCAEVFYADHAVLCTPLFISRRLLGEYASKAIESCSQTMLYSPWCVANVFVPSPLGEWPGMPRAWDNVMHLPDQVSRFNLGYVDAMHQSTRPTPASAGPTVLSCYYAYGTDPRERKALLNRTWKEQADIVLNDLSAAHPDIRDKAKRIDIVRYGHAMAVPAPGMRSSAALDALRAPQKGRIHFAHSDLSAYSVFEEAFYWGTTVGQRVAKVLTSAR